MDKSVSGQQNFRSDLELKLALVSHHPLLGFGAKILPKTYLFMNLFESNN